MERRYIESFFFLALLLGTLAIVTRIILPFLNTAILAAVLAFLFSGAYARLLRWVPNRSLSAALVTLLVLVTILVPFSLAGWRIARESADLYASLREHADGDTVAQTLDTIQDRLPSFIPAAQLDPQVISGRLQQVLEWLLAHLGPVFSGITRIIFNFFLLLLFFYYLIKDGERMKRRIMELSPLSDTHEQQILDTIGRAISATVRGKILLAILQGLVAGVGFGIFGVPNAALWGAFLMLASFIPSIGTSLVQIPAILYLLATDHTGAAIGLAVWAVLIVGLIDNVLGPRLMAKGARVHPAIMMVAVLGGIPLFGPIGLLIGPILISLLFALFDIYLTLVRQPE